MELNSEDHPQSASALPGFFCKGMDSVHVGTGMDSTARTVCWPTAVKAGLQPVWLAREPSAVAGL